jgi:hypothetical protein
MHPVLLDLGISLAGGMGTGEPTITAEDVCFNGLRHCGHTKQDIGIAWPEKIASGISTDLTDSVRGKWFAGRLLQHRVCDGDCSHETLYFPRVLEEQEWQKPVGGRCFQCCKTAYKPYDLAVNCFLIIAKHHLGQSIVIQSDGTNQHWQDAKEVCQRVLGYGVEFQLDTKELMIVQAE